MSREVPTLTAADLAAKELVVDHAAVPGSRLQRARPAWWGRVLRVEWLGQTAASLCWIASVFAYGIGSTGDVLQLCAASAWLAANLAVAVNLRKH
ncbi:MAG: hypothetical protein AAF328_08665 [Planctomycetota bacterium]